MVAKDISFSAPFLNSLTPDLLGMAVESRLSRSSKWRPSQTWFHFRYFFLLSLCLRMRNGNESKEEDFLPSGKISMMLIGAAGINLEAIDDFYGHLATQRKKLAIFIEINYIHRKFINCEQRYIEVAV